jgi:hypothetical protein
MVTMAVPVTMPVTCGNVERTPTVGPVVGSPSSNVATGQWSTPCFDNQFQLNENDCHEI